MILKTALAAIAAVTLTAGAAMAQGMSPVPNPPEHPAMVAGHHHHHHMARHRRAMRHAMHRHHHHHHHHMMAKKG